MLLLMGALNTMHDQVDVCNSMTCLLAETELHSISPSQFQLLTAYQFQLLTAYQFQLLTAYQSIKYCYFLPKGNVVSRMLHLAKHCHTATHVRF